MIQWAEQGTLLPNSPFAATRHLPTRPQAEQLLKEPLRSFRDGQAYRNLPKLKGHLEEAFKGELQEKEKALKRKHAEGQEPEEKQTKKLKE